MGPHSSAGRALQRERKGHGFESLWLAPKPFFRANSHFQYTFQYVQGDAPAPYDPGLKSLFKGSTQNFMSVHFALIRRRVELLKRNFRVYWPRSENIYQWNLDLTKRQGTGKIGPLNRGFVKSKFVFHIFYCDLNYLGWRISFSYNEDFVT